MNKALSLLSVCLALVLGAFVAVPVAHAQDDLRQRQAARLPQVDALKLAGKVGENNGGYLEARESLSGSEQEILKAENADRRTVYGMIAKKTGTSADEVGKTRAAQLAERSAHGVWLQRPTGEWYKK